MKSLLQRRGQEPTDDLCYRVDICYPGGLSERARRKFRWNVEQEVDEFHRRMQLLTSQAVEGRLG